MKKKLAAFSAFVLMTAPAFAAPVSIEPIVDDAVAQTSLTITEAFPYVAAVIGGLVLFRLVKRFVK